MLAMLRVTGPTDIPGLANRTDIGGVNLKTANLRGVARAVFANRVGVDAFDLEAKRAQQVDITLVEGSRRLVSSLGPVLSSRRAELQFVQRDQPLVVEPRQRRLQGRQRLREKTEGGVPVGLIEGFATETLDLASINFRIDWRFLARCTAQSRAARVQHDE